MLKKRRKADAVRFLNDPALPFFDATLKGDESALNDLTPEALRGVEDLEFQRK